MIDVTFPKRMKPLPPGYRVTQLDSGHFMWIGPFDKKLGREAESNINVNQWAVRRNAFAHAAWQMPWSIPILWSAPMVRALLAGRKTQTRRLVKPAPTLHGEMWGHKTLVGHFAEHVFGSCFANLTGEPYARVGDLLWGRETYAVKQGGGAWYRADGDAEEIVGKWTPSIFMRRWASRLHHEVTAVRVERLKDISDDDAIAEGLEEREGDDRHDRLWSWPGSTSLFESPRACYWAGWDTINKKTPASSNPWVWCISFKPVSISPQHPFSIDSV